MTIKDTLLQILSDTTIDEQSTERLLDLLADKLAKQQEEIKRLRAENSAEYQRLQDEREIVRRELHELRTNPLKTWIASTMDFFFRDRDTKFIVHINFGSVELIKKQGETHFPLQRIPHL